MSGLQITFAVLGYFLIGLIGARVVWQTLTKDLKPKDDTWEEGWLAFATLILWPLWFVAAAVALPVLGIIAAITWKPGEKK